MEITGIAKNVQVVPKPTKNGKTFNHYHFEVNGTPVKTIEFNVKTGAKSVLENMPVTVRKEKNQQGYDNDMVYDAPHGTGSVAAPQQTQVASSPAPQARAYSSQDDDRQTSIRIQSARKDAAILVAAMLTSESIPKTKRTDDQILSLTERLTAALYASEERLRANPTGEVEMPEVAEDTE